MPTTNSTPVLVLGSSSPRRHQLMRYLGVPFTIDPSTIDETPPPNATPSAVALSLAQQKAVDVARRHDDAVVIGADTLVDLDGRILNKPVDVDDAVQMLRMLVGNTHQVHSGIAVWRSGRLLSRVISATVTMHPATDDAIRAYVAGGEPMDKAGAYAAQGEGASLIERVDGPYLAVVGLPLLALRALLLQTGVPLSADVPLLERLERGEMVGLSAS
jgi:septum formation protein